MTQDFGGARNLLKSMSFLKSTGIDEMKLEIRCLEGTAGTFFCAGLQKAGIIHLISFFDVFIFMFFLCVFLGRLSEMLVPCHGAVRPSGVWRGRTYVHEDLARRLGTLLQTAS